MKAALRLREVVDARGLDIRDVAQQAGVDAETARRLYAGEATELDLTTLGHLAQVLGVQPPDLIEQVEEPQESVLEGAPAPRADEVPTQSGVEVKGTGEVEGGVRPAPADPGGPSGT